MSAWRGRAPPAGSGELLLPRARARSRGTVLSLRPEQPGLPLRLPLPAALTTQAPNRALRATDQDPAASANSRPERPAQDLGFPAPGEEQAQSIVLCRRRQLLVRESPESGNARCVLRAAGRVRGWQRVGWRQTGAAAWVGEPCLPLRKVSGAFRSPRMQPALLGETTSTRALKTQQRGGREGERSVCPSAPSHPLYTRLRRFKGTTCLSCSSVSLVSQLLLDPLLWAAREEGSTCLAAGRRRGRSAGPARSSHPSAVGVFSKLPVRVQEFSGYADRIRCL